MRVDHVWKADTLAPTLPRHIPSLEGLRALSIACVLIGHASLSHNAPLSLRYFGHLGNFGVRCFFVISGFLITALLLREKEARGEISLKNFYIRRALRIIPASLTYIAVIAAFAAAGTVSLKRYDLLHALTYTMNYHRDRAVWYDHLWSLSVEEQFYLLWPGLLCLVGLRRGVKSAWGVIAMGPVIRALMWFCLGASNTAMIKHFESNADALATGCVLCVSFNWLSARGWYFQFQRSLGFWTCALALIGYGNYLFVRSPAAFYIVGQTLANVGTALVIDWCIRYPHSAFGRVLSTGPAVYLGTISYSLYLWQNAFLNDEWSIWPGFFPFNILCSFVMALLSYHFVERYFLTLKTAYATYQPLALQWTSTNSRKSEVPKLAGLSGPRT
jgi:peptidoglycan/LPS O-acetylase OafA/YrhL